MKTKLCLASNNPHKIEELQKILGKDFEVLTMNDIGCTDEIEETGSTFYENSQIKAEYIYNKFNINVIADDSGLEIEALDNQPGVYSARYAGEPSDSERNIDKVLAAMLDKSNRKAQFKTVICLMQNGKIIFFEGEIKGEITHKRAGKNGFGYDSIFKPEGHSQTFAELTSAVKNEISHRAIATKQVIAYLMGIKNAG